MIPPRLRSGRSGNEEAIDPQSTLATHASSVDRVTFVIASLASGGAERVITMMANHWAAAGREVTLVTIYGESADFFQLDERVRRIALRLGFATSGPLAAAVSNLRRIRQLRRAIIASRPEVVISFMTETNLLTLLALRRTPLPVVISERTDPAQQPLGRVWRTLRRLLYRHADAIVVQSPEVRSWTSAFAHASRIHVLPNPIRRRGANHSSRVRPAQSRSPWRTIVAMGRLSHEKGFDLLVRAFARVAPRHPEWSLTIFGEGDDRTELEALARDLGVSERVSLPGRVEDPESHLARGEIFALSSRYEGFPNVLLEAMACGLPVVATDCPSGPRQIVRHDHDGLLVRPEDADALAQALDALMTSPELRERLGAVAPEVVERFGVEQVLARWDELLAGVAAVGKEGR